jgi:DNA-binding LacI/PurR family transcriptional regulator
MRRTIRDVSQRAGVSVGTVSNVLNAPHLVSKPTLSKVLEAIEDLDYRPNRAARGLQARRTHLIGYRLPGPGVSPALDVFLHQVVATAASHDLALTLFSPRPGQDDLEALREMVSSGDVDGLILSETNYGDRRVVLLHDLGFPFAAFGSSDLPFDFPWVDIDGAHGIALVVEHLVAQGHDRIALIAWPEGSKSGDQRVDGYHLAMERAGLDPDPDLLIRTNNGFEQGRRAAFELFGRKPRPTAVVTVQDELAFGVFAAAAEIGLRVGDEVGVAGFDDSDAARLMSPGLTSVRQPFEQVAEALVDLLVARLHEPDGDPQTVLVKPELVIRGSTVRTPA